MYIYTYMSPLRDTTSVAVAGSDAAPVEAWSFRCITINNIVSIIMTGTIITTYYYYHYYALMLLLLLSFRVKFHR